MGFLQPALLLLGLGIAIPIFLHLFQRHQGPRVVFPALRYLRRAERESARKVRLRQVLLMLLRVAAVLLIAFAAARPFVRAGGVRHEPTAVVIILDNSLSTGAVSKDHRVIDGLKARALETMQAAEPEDVFWLLRAGAPDEPAYPGDAIETARHVRETEPTDAAADIAAAIIRARSILAAGAGKRAAEIHLLSDLQKTNFLATTSAEPHDPALVIWHADDTAAPNRWIADVTIGGGIAPGANERSSVLATIGGTADGAARAATPSNTTSFSDSANVRLLLVGRLAAATRAAAGGTALLQFPARPAGILTGWVEMDADAVRADNRRYFATRVALPPTVARSGNMAFVDEALGVLENAGRIRRTTPAAASILLLPGGGAEAVMTGGRTVVVFPPESPLEIQAVNRRLAASGIPWSYSAQQMGGAARFELRDSADALLHTLENARLSNVYALHPGASARGDSVLLRLRDHSAWAVRGDRASGGRYIILASPLTESASSIPTSAAMLPLLDRIIRNWAAAGSGTEEALPGDIVALPSGSDAVLRPDSTVEPVTDLQYHVPPRAGIYQIMSNNKAVSAFAVNPPPIESDLGYISDRALRTMLPLWNITIVSDAGHWKNAIFRERLGREMWRALLLALLFVLVMEALLAATGMIRSRSSRDAIIPREVP